MLGAAKLESSSVSTPLKVFAQRAHIPQLDGLRGLAILLVTLYRFGREIPKSSSGPFLAQAIELGTRGVELFFVLSGFLITGILLDSRGQSRQLVNFFARRSLRILPLYIAALVACLWLLPVVANLTGSWSLQQAFAAAQEQQVYLWCYLTNVRMALVDAWCFGPLDHFWSLAVEEHFYLVWPLAVLWLTRRSLSTWTVMLLAACVLSRTAWLALGGAATAAEVLTVWRCDGLLIGAFIAMSIRGEAWSWSSLTRAAHWLWLPLGALAIGLDATDRRLWLASTTLWNGVWACLLILLMDSVRSQTLSRLFSHAGLRTLGKLSYGMYVFQAPLIPIAAALGYTVGVSLVQNLLYVPVMFALSFGLAWCSWHGFEKHWLRLKDYFPQSDSPPAPQPVPMRWKANWGAARPAP